MAIKLLLFSVLICWLMLGGKSFGQAAWERHTIDNEGSGADGIKFADLNKDGKPDLVCGWEESGVTKVYLHPQKEDVKANWPKVVVGKTPNVEDAVFADMNSDGLKDVVSCTENGSQKVFVHFNTRSEVMDGDNWEQVVIPVSDGKMSWMYAESLQIDGENGDDLLAAGKGKNAALGWFRVPDSNEMGDWEWFEISKVGWIMGMLIEDMDADGDKDVVITDRTGPLRACRWLENPGKRKAQLLPWKNHIIGAQGLEVMFMTIRDLNADGKPEIIVAERTQNTLRIYTKNNSKWLENKINLPEKTGRAKSVEAGDINNDGVMDVIVSTNTLKEKKHGLIYLDGNKIKQVTDNDWKSISGKHVAKYDKVELLDVDEDGDLDILICEENFGANSEGLGVIWYENPSLK